MCYDPLFHLSLSPPQLISLHPPLHISLFSTSWVLSRKGRGQEWNRGLAPFGQDLTSITVNASVHFKHSRVTTKTNPGDTVEPACLSLLDD